MAPGNIPIAHSFESILRAQSDYRAHPINANTAKVLRESSANTNSVHENILLLEQGKARVIFTGQQLGLFLGPALTLYKIFSAIALARSLSEKLQEPIIPVFWLHGDDHDFEEIRKFHFPAFSSSGEVDISTVELKNQPELEKISVGRRTLPEETPDCIDSLSKHINLLPRFENLLRTSFQAGKNFRQAFLEVLQELLGTTGLLIFDPLHDLAKTESKPLFRLALEHSEEFEVLVQADTDLLRARGESEQVALRPGSPLFFVHSPDPNGPRFRLLWRQNRFEAIGGGDSFTREELLQLLESCPARFSPSALLRPLLQDSLFPTLAYVGGDAELRYFRQISSLYPLIEKKQPLAIRRLSAFVLEPKTLRLLKSLDIEPQDLVERKEEVLKRLRGDFLSSTEFSHKQREFFESLKGFYHTSLQSLENPMQKALARNLDRIDRALCGVQSRYSQVLETRDDVQSLQLRKLLTLLFPMDHWQEREISGLYYVLKYGEEFLEKLTSVSNTWALDPKETPFFFTLG